MKAVKDAVYSRLTGDAAYIALVGSPASAPYRTYYQDPPAPAFDGVNAPMTVFYLRPALLDTRLPREILSYRGELHVNTWDREEGGVAQHEEVMDRVVALLHHNPNDAGFRAILAREPEDLNDAEIMAVGVHAVFDVYYRRNTL